MLRKRALQHAQTVNIKSPAKSMLIKDHALFMSNENCFAPRDIPLGSMNMFDAMFL
jgi:hypothetical protein